MSGRNDFAKKSKNFTDHQTHSRNFCHLNLSQKQYLGIKLGFCALAPDLFWLLSLIPHHAKTLLVFIFFKVSEHNISLVLEKRKSSWYIEDDCSWHQRYKNTCFALPAKHVLSYISKCKSTMSSFSKAKYI